MSITNSIKLIEKALEFAKANNKNGAYTSYIRVNTQILNKLKKIN